MGPIAPIGRTTMLLTPYEDRAGCLADIFGFFRAWALELADSWLFHRVMFRGIGRAQQIFKLSARAGDHVDTCFGKGMFEAMVCGTWQVGDTSIGFVFSLITQSNIPERKNIK